jgi:hypothetical protein
MNYFIIRSVSNDFLKSWKWTDDRIHSTQWGSSETAHRFLTKEEAVATFNLFSAGSVEIVPHGDFALDQAA